VAGIRHAYLCRQRSVRLIADESGLSRARVSAVVRMLGAPIAERGAGRPRPWTRVADPPDLRDLLIQWYCRERRSCTDIAAMLGVDARTVRNRLQTFGIPRRSKGSHNREDRQELDREHLRHLLIDAGLTARAISLRTGAPYPAVLRSAHDYGLPVRLGGPPPRDGPADIELIHALYADPQVRAVLRSHHIPRVAPGAPLWERFPEPTDLPETLLAALYVDCGLSTTQIELLTGHPRPTVLRHMRSYGIPRRPAGGRAPFWSRWRETAH
jgi:hypothetical protein